MKAKSLKTLIAVFVFSIVAVLTVGLYPSRVSATTNPLDTLITKFEMSEGASARLDDVNGVRFKATLLGNEYETLEALENVTVSYGMIIAPRNYAETNAFTIDNLFGEKAVYGWRTVNADGTLSGEIKEGLTEVVNLCYETLAVNDNGDYDIKGSLVSIKETNLTLDLVGTAYVSYNDGTNTYYRMAGYYGNDIANNSRSIVEVAQVLAQSNPSLKTQLEELYLNKVKDQVVNYTVETYVGNTLQKSEPLTETINETVTITPAEFDGLTLNEEKSVLSGLTLANGKLTLKVVYDEVAEYQVLNGDFEMGNLNGWYISNENIGAVSSDENYWVGDGERPEGYKFGLDGTYMFSNYAKTSGDGEIGYLQSETFTIGGSGWLTFKIGGAKNSATTYVDIVNNENGAIIKRLSNGKWQERIDGVLSGCNLNAYKVNLSEYLGAEVYIKVVDIAKEDYGVLFLDSFNALYACEPNDSFALATEVVIDDGLTIYNLNNGSFSNDMYGWYENVITALDDDRRDLGNISTTETYWGDRQFNNNGKFYSAYEPIDKYEASTGYLRSSAFTLGGSGYITFGIGGIRNPEQIWVEIIDVETNSPISNTNLANGYAKFYNVNFNDCSIVYYKLNLSIHLGKTLFINIIDNATSNYGLIFCDEFITYYENESDVPNYASLDYSYSIRNGGFEEGLNGWALTAGEVPGVVTGTTINHDWSGLVEPEGTKYFAGFEVDGSGHEHKKGTLRSDVFMLKSNGWLSFKLGGSNPDLAKVYIRVVNAITGETMALFRNDKFDRCIMISYKYQFNNESDTLCYIELCDWAEDHEGGYRLLVLDSFVANQEVEGADFITNRK